MRHKCVLKKKDFPSLNRWTVATVRPFESLARVSRMNDRRERLRDLITTVRDSR